MELPAVIGEADFVHQLLHQEDPAPARLQNIVAVERIRHAHEVESTARITHDNAHVAGWIRRFLAA